MCYLLEKGDLDMEDFEFSVLIEQYIRQNLDLALLARYSEDTYNRIHKERENLELYRSMVLNPEVRDRIIEKMVDYVITNLRTSYKDFPSYRARENYYFNSVKEFLNTHQMVLLAKKFNQEIQNNKFVK